MKGKNKTESEAKKIVAPIKKELNISARGRTFEGTITKKFPKRVVIEFERMIHIRKYERFAKSKTKLHARIPEGMDKELALGDYIKIRECRPLSKLIHFIVIEKIRSKEDKTGGKEK